MAQLIDILQAGLCDSSGNPLANGKVTTFVAGTTTKQTIFQDEELTNPFPNPVTVDSRGKLQAYTDQNLKLIIETAAGSTVDTIENIVNPRGNIGTDEIQDDAVTAAKINANVAGNGLTQATSGALDVNPDDSTIEIVSNAVRVKDLGIVTAKLAVDSVTTTKILNANVTRAKLATVGQQISSSSGAFTLGVGIGPTDITNLSISITVTGRPVVILAIADGVSTSRWGTVSTAGSAFTNVRVVRDAATLATYTLTSTKDTGATLDETIEVPVTVVHFIDTTSGAGTFTYKLQMNTAVFSTGAFNFAKLFVYEMF